MAEHLEGAAGLRRRLGAISAGKNDAGFMRRLGTRVVTELKHNVARKTSYTSRTIALGAVGRDSAEIRGSPVLIYLDQGTRAHEIRPVRRRFLKFAARGSSRTLAGRARKGQAETFSKLVHHPGTRAQPFIRRSIEDALERSGLAAEIVERWNKAD